MVQALKVLFLAAEATPFVKTGGLADVAGELPQALGQQGLDVRLCLPLHTSVDRSRFNLKQIARFTIPRGTRDEPVRLFETSIGGLKIWLIDGEPVRRAPGVYGEVPLDAEKFIFTSLAALKACERLDQIPDIVHGNDWHTAAAVMKLAELRQETRSWKKVHSLFTIHNLAYMGDGAEEALEAYGLPILDVDHIPNQLKILPMAQGIKQADWVTTVSPTYAREIRTKQYGAGLHLLLKARKDRLSGILNGIDSIEWDPAVDHALVQSFDKERLEARAANKAALQAELGLEVRPQTPLMGLVSRLDHQKGIDLLWPAVTKLSQSDWQLVLLGTGDPRLEQVCLKHAAKDERRVRVILRFDLDLARQIYAGSDMLLIPSRYEPCGLTQMIAMRYGSIPIVRATGGLVDTVPDVDQSAGGTGFVFKRAMAKDLKAAMERALERYTQPVAWRTIQQMAMSSDFSWPRQAAAYRDLYGHIGTLDVS